MKFFVKDFCETIQAGVIILGMQVDNDVWIRGIVNQPSDAYSFLNISEFLSFHTSNDEIFRQRFPSVKLCKLELSYLLCRLTMMNCIVGLRTAF